MTSPIYIVHDRKASIIYGIFKSFDAAKDCKAKLLKSGISAGIDKAITDLF